MRPPKIGVDFLIGEFSSRVQESHDHLHIAVRLSPPVRSLRRSARERTESRCHSRRRGRARHTFAGNGVRAATVRVVASRRSIYCPYDALPRRERAVSINPTTRRIASTPTPIRHHHHHHHRHHHQHLPRHRRVSRLPILVLTWLLLLVHPLVDSSPEPTFVVLRISLLSSLDSEACSLRIRRLSSTRSSRLIPSLLFFSDHSLLFFFSMSPYVILIASQRVCFVVIRMSESTIFFFRNL